MSETGSGKYDKRVTILKNNSTSVAPGDENWVPDKVIWASVEFLKANKDIIEMNQKAPAQIKVKTWYRQLDATQNRVAYQGVAYSIDSAPPFRPGDEMELLCTEAGKTPSEEPEGEGNG